jgi:serine protease inhibitor
MKTLAMIFCLVLAGAPLAGGKAAEPRALQASTALNAIGTELLASRLRSEGVGNAMVSPVSLFYALSVLALGAEGGSQELLRSRLLVDPRASLEDLAPRLAALLSHEDSSGSNHGAFRLGNSLWSTDGASNGQPFVFASEFAAAAAALYGADRQSLDFMSPDSASVINDWASEQTRGLVPTIIDPGLLSRLEWVILNTALFEGGWGTPMQRVAADGDYRFVGLDGSLQTGDTIRTRDYVSRVLDLDDGSVAFRLPFAGGKYAFVVHLPANDQADVAGWLSTRAVPGMADVIGRVFASSQAPHQLTIQLPVFAFSHSVTMNRNSVITHALGLAPLFGPEADLSGLVDFEQTSPGNRETRVGIIKQDSRIELDEKGVRAAAVTLIGGIRKATTITPAYPRREIVVDRPFAFAIVENGSQTMLFNGVLTSLPR